MSAAKKKTAVKKAAKKAVKKVAKKAVKKAVKKVAKKAVKKVAKKATKAATKAANKKILKNTIRKFAKKNEKAAPVEVELVPKKKTRAVKPKFKIDQQVVYPFHGVGLITLIDKIDITGEPKMYYTIDFRNGELTLKIPVDQQDERGMRKVVSKKEVPRIIGIIKKKPPVEESDWKVRHNLYLEKLKSGDIYETAKVARNLSKRGPQGELSMSEKRLLEASVQLLVHEIASASGEAIETVEVELSKILKGKRP